MKEWLKKEIGFGMKLGGKDEDGNVIFEKIISIYMLDESYFLNRMNS